MIFFRAVEKGGQGAPAILIPPILILCIGPFSKHVTWEGGGSRRRKKQNMT